MLLNFNDIVFFVFFVKKFICLLLCCALVFYAVYALLCYIIICFMLFCGFYMLYCCVFLFRFFLYK